MEPAMSNSAMSQAKYNQGKTELSFSNQQPLEIATHYKIVVDWWRKTTSIKKNELAVSQESPTIQYILYLSYLDKTCNMDIDWLTLTSTNWESYILMYLK